MHPSPYASGVLHRPLAWLLLALAVLFADASTAAAFRVAVIGDAGDPRAATVMETVAARLAADCETPCDAPAIVRQFAPDDSAWTTSADRWDLLVAVGSGAGRSVARSTVAAPRLYTYLPRAAWTELQACCVSGRQPHAALFIDQPIARQLELVRELVPGAARVGVLLGGASSKHLAELEQAAADTDLGLDLARVASADELGTALRGLVRTSDALLALPDPEVYNRNTIYAVLLTTYSARVPVIGYSAALTRAGAAAAVFASPRDVGVDTATIIQGYRATGSFAAPGYGTRYSVSVNQDVVRSLRLPRTSEQTLLDRLKANSP